MEINVAIAVLGVAAAVLLSWAIVYFTDKTTRRGWRVYADSAADANALAALTLAQLRKARKN